ncbi:MAG: outer membrane protein assembly factor BamD [Mariprofundus sp.]
MNLSLSKSILAAIVAITLISGCASDDINYANAQLEYAAAKEKLNEGNYGAVTMNLDKFSAKYPYSKYATQADLLRIFAAYKNEEFILSETLSKRFVEEHPRHANVDYAKYMLAMSYYKQRAPAEKDPTMNRLSIEAFKELLEEHPDSAYARDGSARLQSLYNTLAKHELTVGKFYYDKNRYVAAANRFQEVVKSYQTTPSIEEALYYLASSYAKMGLSKDAHQIALLLRHNYPNSSWSSKAKDYL